MPIHPATRLKLDAATLARLSRLAGARQRPANQLMQEAIEEYLDREDRREKFQRDAFTAWAQFQATGIHVMEPRPTRGWRVSKQARMQSHRSRIVDLWRG